MLASVRFRAQDLCPLCLPAPAISHLLKSHRLRKLRSLWFLDRAASTNILVETCWWNMHAVETTDNWPDLVPERLMIAWNLTVCDLAVQALEPLAVV